MLSSNLSSRCRGAVVQMGLIWDAPSLLIIMNACDMIGGLSRHCPEEAGTKILSFHTVSYNILGFGGVGR